MRTMANFKVQMLWNNISKGELSAVVNLLGTGNINLEERDDNGQTFLMVASEKGELNIVRELLEANADPNAIDNDNWTALLWAAKQGNLEIVIELLEKGSDIEHKDMCGWTSLMWACYKGRTTVVQELLDRGASPNVKAEHSMTCLIWAAGRGHLDIANLLIEKGAKVNTPDKYGTTPLIWASRKGYLEIVEVLISHGATVDVSGMNSWTPLLVATKGGYADIVNIILEHNPGLNCVDKDGLSPLAIAAKEGYTEIAHELLNNGAYVNLPDRVGDTILIHAIKGGHKEIVRALLKKFADVDVEGSEGKTALYWSVEKGHNDILKYLLEMNPDLEKSTKDGDTALLRAVRTRNVDAIKRLLDKGGRVSAVDKKGDTPLHIALRARSKKVTELLLRNPRHSRLLYKPNKNGETPYSIDAYHQKGILAQIYGHKNLNASDGENLLGYEVHSSALADILSEPTLTTPITVGLYAKWGSGKSFLLGRLVKEMRSFAKQHVEEHFRVSWILFLVLFVVNFVLGLSLGLTVSYIVGLAVGFGLFPVQYFVLGALHLIVKRYSFEVLNRISLAFRRNLDRLKLLLLMIFIYPKRKNRSSTVVPNVRFLFSESTRLTSVGGEKALAGMIASLSQSVQREYGFFISRLFRVFKPQTGYPPGRFKTLCCIPFFVIWIFLFASLTIGISLLVIYGIDENATINAVMITFACIVGLTIISNIYTLGQVIASLPVSPHSRILQAAEQIDSLKMDGFMQTLKQEVDMMSKLVSIMDRFTGQETRLVVIVDGLDTCEQEKVLQVLDIITALFSDVDSPFITILAADPHIIIKGIEQNLGSNFQDSNVNGYDYLRNTVHLPFYLQSQGVKVQKQDIIDKSNSLQEISAKNDSPRHAYRTQESVASSIIASWEQQKTKRRRTRADSVISGVNPTTYSSGFDISHTVAKNDYFSDINPRSMRRLMNIVAVTGRLLRAYNIDFSWYRLAAWVNIIEQWPYRLSWIIMHFEETQGMTDETTLISIYDSIVSRIPVSKDIDPLLEIDRNVRKFEEFLRGKSSGTTSLNIGDLKQFLPCTINLDPYLRKLIRQMEQNTELQRQDVSMGPVFPNQMPQHQDLNKAGSVRPGYTPPQRGMLPMNAMYPHGYHPMAMPHHYGFPSPYMMPYTSPPTSNKSTPKKEAKIFVQGFDMKTKLSQLSVDDVGNVLCKIEGVQKAAIAQYKNSIQENNINGLVLSHCKLDELREVLCMKFGDWQLFKSAITKLREIEEEATSPGVTEVPSDNSLQELRNVKFSVSNNDSNEPDSPRSEIKAWMRDAKPNLMKSLTIDDREMTIAKSDSLRGMALETTTFKQKPLPRKDSILQQLHFENEILNEVIEEFAEGDDNEDEDNGRETVEFNREDRPSIRSMDSNRSKKGVEFFLSSVESGSPDAHDVKNRNQQDNISTEFDPLLESELTDKSDLHRGDTIEIPSLPKPGKSAMSPPKDKMSLNLKPVRPTLVTQFTLTSSTSSLPSDVFEAQSPEADRPGAADDVGTAGSVPLLPSGAKPKAPTSRSLKDSVQQYLTRHSPGISPTRFGLEGETDPDETIV